jgi:hypothetical protein
MMPYWGDKEYPISRMGSVSTTLGSPEVLIP